VSEEDLELGVDMCKALCRSIKKDQFIVRYKMRDNSH